MEIPRLILPFLGSRDYLHGTTLFDALLPFAPADAAITCKFSHLICSNSVAVGAEEGGASFSWKSAAEGPGALHVRALEMASPLERRPYPESLVSEALVHGEKSVRYESAAAPFSFVSTLIPMHKALLSAHTKQDVPGQWLFARLDLSRRLTSFERIELRLAGVFQQKAAHSSIFVNDQPAGAIYFSWWPK
jgi:hypothetical protein